jgi:hypothetical protein
MRPTSSAAGGARCACGARVRPTARRWRGRRRSVRGARVKHLRETERRRATGGAMSGASSGRRSAGSSGAGQGRARTGLPTARLGKACRMACSRRMRRGTGFRWRSCATERVSAQWAASVPPSGSVENAAFRACAKGKYAFSRCCRCAPRAPRARLSARRAMAAVTSRNGSSPVLVVRARGGGGGGERETSLHAAVLAAGDEPHALVRHLRAAVRACHDGSGKALQGSGSSSSSGSWAGWETWFGCWSTWASCHTMSVAGSEWPHAPASGLHHCGRSHTSQRCRRA